MKTPIPLLIPPELAMTTRITQSSPCSPPPLILFPGARVQVSTDSLIILSDAPGISGSSLGYPSNSNGKSKVWTNEGSNSDPDCNFDVVHSVLEPLSSKKEDERAATQVQNYNESMRLCVKAVKLVSLCFGKHYSARYKVIEDLINSWEKDAEVVIVPVTSGLWSSSFWVSLANINVDHNFFV